MTAWKVGDHAIATESHTDSLRAADVTKGRVYPVLGVRCTRMSISDQVELFLVCDHGGEVWRNASVFTKAENPQTDARPFWIVKGDGPANYEHYTEAMADDEARRLAASCPGKTFTVLGPIRSYKKADIQCTDLRRFLAAGENNEDVPF